MSHDPGKTLRAAVPKHPDDVRSHETVKRPQ